MSLFLRSITFHEKVVLLCASLFWWLIRRFIFLAVLPMIWLFIINPKITKVFCRFYRRGWFLIMGLLLSLILISIIFPFHSVVILSFFIFPFFFVFFPMKSVKTYNFWAHIRTTKFVIFWRLVFRLLIFIINASFWL